MAGLRTGAAGVVGAVGAVVAAVVALGVGQPGGDGPADGTTPTAAPTATSTATPTARVEQPEGQPARILFDAAHGEQAGNADWVISRSMPDPLGEDPAPEDESDWTGALSAWGTALAAYPDTYRLATNPPGRPLTYGVAANGLDLAKVETLVLPEPNRALTDAEQRAVVAFVEGGGGLFLIVDHADSDRDGDGIDSVGVAGRLTAAFADAGLPTGLAVDEADIDSENTDNVSEGAADHPVVDGAWGRATSSILRGGTTITLDRSANAAAACLLHREGADAAGPTDCVLARSEVGDGRLLVWGDSSPVDDGTGDPGDTLYPNFADPRDSNEAWALNGTDWLAGVPG